MAFVQAHIDDLHKSLPRGFIATDGMGWFILWLMRKAEKLPPNSKNILSIKNEKTAKELGVKAWSIIQWKNRLIDAGILTKVPGQSLYYVDKNIMYNGKMLKK